MPGLIALRIDPNILESLSTKLNNNIIITGTNGKTTVSRLLTDFLREQKIIYIHNRIGSNLKRGVVSALIDPYINRKISQHTWGVFETDEADVINILRDVKPVIIVITNLFRDQLDRYGEIDTVLLKWIKALQNNPKTSVLLNGNDPYLVYLSTQIKNKVYFFGINDKKTGEIKPSHTADLVFCYRCFKRLAYNRFYLSHEGIFRCPSCGLAAPALDYWADNVKLSSAGSIFRIKDRKKSVYINSFLPGLFNVFNLTAVYGLLRLLNFSAVSLPSVAKNYQPAFGRGEKFFIKDKQVQILLIKNPTGLNQVIDRLYHESAKLNLLILINDKIADGRDVSWLWDADFEKLFAHTTTLAITGRRVYDMALRAKIAGFSKLIMINDLKKAVDYFLSLKEKQLFILPTYTALLDLRKILYHKGLVQKTWLD